MGTKLDRKDVKIFAENSDATLITEFRTESADGSTASFSRDPDVIQNANYEQGWVENQNNLNTKIFGEDMNAVSYVQSYLLKYLYENGIPEWSATTEYFEHSIARVDNRLFISLTDNNINNDPENTVGEWSEVPLSAINIITSGTGSSILNTSSGNNITLKSLSVDGYASLQDNGDQLNIHVIGGSGIVDAYWGQIQGTLTNQADLVSALGDKQDNITFDSPLSVDVNNEVSIPKATDSVSGYLDSIDFQTFAGKQNALSGFTHSYDSDSDTAQIYPTATNSNVGTNTYPITNINASNVNASAINSGALFNLNGEINIRCQDGESVEIGTDSSIKTLEVTGSGVGVSGGLTVTGTTSTDKIQGLTTAITMQTGASIIPDTDNTYDLGSSSSKNFANLYCNNITSSTGTTVSGDVSLKQGSGSTDRIRIKDSSGTDKAVINADNGNFSVDCNIYPITINQYNLGTGSNRWKKLFLSAGADNGIEFGANTKIYDITGNTCAIGATSQIVLYLGGNAKYNFTTTQATGPAWNVSSDRALKGDIQDLEDGVLDKLRRIETKKYYLKTKEELEGVKDEIKNTAHTYHYGIIANDVNADFPEVAVKNEETYSVDLYGLITLTLKGLQELADRVDNIEERLLKLEANKEELKK